MSGRATPAKRKAAKTQNATKKVSSKKTASAAKRTVTRTAAPRRKALPQREPVALSASPDEVSHRLHLLLHSIHQIERYEERLCSMQDAIKRTGRISAPLLRDLQTILNEMPSDEFQHDLDAVRHAVLG